MSHPGGEPAYHDVDAVPREARGIQGLPAGIVTRTAANTVDFAVTVGVLAGGYAAWFAARFLVQPAQFSPPAPPLGVVLACGAAVLFWYFALSWATTGRTYGDHLLGLRVVDARGDRLRWRHALLRSVLCVAFPIGLFWSVVSAKSKSVQDSVLRTAVVYDWVASAPVPHSSISRSDGTSGRLRSVPEARPDGPQVRPSPRSSTSGEGAASHPI